MEEKSFVDIGEKLLTAQNQSLYEEPEPQQPTGFYAKMLKLKTLLNQALSHGNDTPSVKTNNDDVDKNVGMEEDTHNEETDASFIGDYEKEGDGRGVLDDSLLEGSKIVDEFITIKDESTKSSLSNKKEFKFHRNQVREEGMSMEEVNEKCLKIIEETCIAKESPVWFNASGQREHSNRGKYRDENLARILHAECLDFAAFMTPTDDEHKARLFVIKSIAEVVYAIWPKSELNLFGSFQSHMYLPQSDLDMVILNVPTIGKNGGMKRLRELAKALKARGLTKDLQVINARVAIIKFVDTIVGFSIDISLNTESGVFAAIYIRDMLYTHKALRPLVFILKQFLQIRGLNEVFSGGLGSFGLSSLILSFLEMHPRIKAGEIHEEENLGVLLMEFLDLYGKRFNYDQVGISLNEGGRYFVKSRLGNLGNNRPHALTIEDPLDSTNDVTRGTFNMNLIAKAFSAAFDVLSSTVYEITHRQSRYRDVEIYSILSTILFISPAVLQHRDHVQRIAKTLPYFDQNFIRDGRVLSKGKSMPQTHAGEKRKRK